MATLEGTQLGPYLVGGQIGSGGMATVYKAYHARLDRHVAIKVMHDAFQQDENFLARFEREAQIVARLEHPNIVPIYDFADVEARPYLVMKFIEGTTLKQKMFKNPPTLAEIKRILPAIAAALDYAHQRGILHRDIKPSNVILDASGTPYLMDFGLARIVQLGESTLSQDSILGTPQYISPEQAMGKRDLTPATDLYSLGVVLYELVTGRVPFASDTPFATIHDHIYTALPLPSTVNPELPPDLDRVLDKAMAKRPEDRYKSASELVNAFLQTVEQAHLETLNADRREVAPPVRTQPLDDALTTPLPKGDNSPPARKVAMMEIDGKPKRQVEAKIDFDLNNVNWNEVARGTGDFVRTWGERIERFGNELDTKSKAKSADPLLSKDPDSIRRRIEQQFKKRNEFIGHVISYVLVNGVLWIIFGLSNGGEINIEGEIISVGSFPWPLIVMLGWGAGLVAHGIETYFQTGGRMRQRQITIERELMRQYGDDWQEVTDAKSVKAVRKRVEKPFKKVEEFYQHLGVYIMINVMLWIMYGFSIEGASLPFMGDLMSEMVDVPFPWPLMVTLGWGIGLFANAMEALSAPVSERAIQRAIEQEQARMIPAKAKRSESAASVVLPRVRMNADGEFTDSMVEELGELEAGRSVPNRIENYDEQDDDNDSLQGRSRRWRARNNRRR